MRDDLGDLWLFVGGLVADNAVWQCKELLLHLQEEAAAALSLLRASHPSASPAPGHLRLSPASSEAGRCFENRMLGLRVIKEKTERETV